MNILNMINHPLIYLVAIGLLTFSSCRNNKNDDPDPTPTDTTVSVTGVELTPELVRMGKGSSPKQLIATVIPDSASNKQLSWSSSDPSIVSVDQSGLITAKDIGSATITVTTEDGEFTATSEVSVSNLLFYEASDEDFVNPERGFYKYSQTRSDNYNPLSVNTLMGYREGSAAGSYTTLSSLVFRYYILRDFVDSPISEDFLASFRADFEIAREAGVKLIPRFTYTNSTESGDCPEDWICPPYGDTSKEIILQHISQLGPILSENKDVILAVQMGFIGVWGEQYYTDYFGDASSNGGVGKLLDENWQDRIDVLNALLEALPEELMVQVRYPQMKQRAVYGINAPTSSDPLNEDEAFSGSAKSRIGFHNDCLFASSTDFGTYQDYGNSSSPAQGDISNLKSYFADDSKYVIVGGETCSDGNNPYSDCAPEGKADTDLRYLHYTYLNADYNNEVNNDWVDGGCMEDIKKNLGYRIVLDSAGLPSEVESGQSLSLNLHLSNVGYAAPINERPVYLVLRNPSGEVRFEFETDIRFWSSNVTLSGSFDLPDNLNPGQYELLLHLPDANSSISSRSEYAIRLANDLWEPETGMNTLNHIVEVK